MRVGCHSLATSGNRSAKDCPETGVFDPTRQVCQSPPTGQEATDERAAEVSCLCLSFVKCFGPIVIIASGPTSWPCFVKGR